MQDRIGQRSAAPAQVLEFLTFKLGDEEYGIDIQKVQELRAYEKVTRIANVEKHILGVLNLRGIIVPIVDLRIQLDLGSADYGQFTVVIVLNIGERVIGMVVDGVSDVLELDPAQIRPAPEMGAAIRTDYLLGLGAVDARMLILVDIERLLAGPELGLAVPAPLEPAADTPLWASAFA